MFGWFPETRCTPDEIGMYIGSDGWWYFKSSNQRGTHDQVNNDCSALLASRAAGGALPSSPVLPPLPPIQFPTGGPTPPPPPIFGVPATPPGGYVIPGTDIPYNPPTNLPGPGSQFPYLPTALPPRTAGMSKNTMLALGVGAAVLVGVVAFGGRK